MTERHDPFGFVKATLPSVHKKGYFAVFFVDGGAKATAVYTEKFLTEVVIPNTLAEMGFGTEYRIFPESEYERVTGRKPC